MKKIAHRILRYYLSLLARVVLWRSRPYIIAIAGTVNKSFVREAVAEILRKNGLAVETTIRSFNTDIGLPLSILGLDSGYDSYKRWLRLLPQAFVQALKRRLPAYVIVELGISHPGDVRPLMSLVEPQMAIITDITQRYRENFGDLGAISQEYAFLLKRLPAGGHCLLNYDTILVRELAAYSKAPVTFFSLENSLSDYTINEQGMSGTITINERAEQFSLPRFGAHHITAYLVARLVLSCLPKA